MAYNKAAATTTSACAGCGERVFPLERMVLADKEFHRGCAKCSHCKGTLSLSNFASANNMLFCKPHFMELFKSSGGKYAFAENKTSQQQQPQSQPAITTTTTTSTAKAQVNKLAAFLSGAPPPTKPVIVADVTPPPPPVVTKPIITTTTTVATANPTTNVTGAAPSKLAAFLSVAEGPSKSVPQPPPPPPAVVVEQTTNLPIKKPVPAAPTPQPVAIAPPKQQQQPPKQQQQPPLLPPTTTTTQQENRTSNLPSSTTISEDVLKLREELRIAQLKNKDLEAELKDFRARLELGDAGKEALVQEIIRLNTILDDEIRKRVECTPSKPIPAMMMNQTRLPPVASSAATTVDPLKTAKKLLHDGRITKIQYDAAVKAYEEANQVAVSSSVNNGVKAMAY